MAEELKPMGPEEELALLEKQLQEHRAKRELVERQFQATMDVVISRHPFDTAILATQYRIDQIRGEMNPAPQVYDPRPRRIRRL